MFQTKSRPTHKKGGQLGNDNAAKTHVGPLDYEQDEDNTADWHAVEMEKQIAKDEDAYNDGIGQYFLRGYLAVNRYLRKGEVFDFPKMDAIKKIIDAMHKSFVPLDRDAIVYRGMNFTPSGTFTDKGFVSTSLSKYTASRFPLGQHDTEHTVAKILVPKGTPVGFANLRAVGFDEREIILPPNLKFKVKSAGPYVLPRNIKVQTNPPKYVEMEIIE